MYCIICGRSAEEVKKLFCFPRKVERSNAWFRAMAMGRKGISCQDVELSYEDITTPEHADTEAQFIQPPSSNGRSTQQVLKKKLKNKIEQLRKLQRECKKRGSKISQLLKSSDDMEGLENMMKHLPRTSQVFILGQIRSGKKLPRGRRWSNDEKVIALALYKRSPKCYTLLRRITALPSKDTLNRVLQRLPFETGINHQVLNYLGQTLLGYDRYCTIAFDEMTIREHCAYNKSKDCIDGVEDLGNGKRSSELARYALVFMLQGINRSWKQPLAYYFTRNGVSAKKIE
ncbi:Transposase protein [Popillia japonica]|uniref:Transposase protein n=1 Tax=Popillia japonica TaxID=7064 RepID=A0AAW1IA48_POPJA